MFTGLIKTQGTIRRVDMRGDCLMTIAMREPFALEIGDSVAVNGICLTVTKIDDNAFKVSLSEETMSRTTAKDWAVGTIVNLEPALKVGDALGGHYVSGHVDGIAKAVNKQESGDSTVWEISVPPTLAQFIAPKGSVTLDGVSLTVNTVTSRQSPVANEAPETVFSVNIIPHTTKVTSFGEMEVGAAINLEIDMLARYVARLMETKSA